MDQLSSEHQTGNLHKPTEPNAFIEGFNSQKEILNWIWEPAQNLDGSFQIVIMDLKHVASDDSVDVREVYAEKTGNLENFLRSGFDPLVGILTLMLGSKEESLEPIEILGQNEKYLFRIVNKNHQIYVINKLNKEAEDAGKPKPVPVVKDAWNH
ncbi:hypothetical protein HK096_004572 [Nowakowskiella sp. JEL0078]|nr:hypothetical protein HK096_004572 [Nowakowskiella sp. JEL0078]